MRRILAALAIVALTIAGAIPAGAHAPTFYGDTAWAHPYITPAPGVMLGAWGDPNCCANQKAAIHQLETNIGRTLAIHLYYDGLDLTNIQSDNTIADDVANGRAPLISWGCSNSHSWTFQYIAQGHADSQAVIDNSLLAIGSFAPYQFFVRSIWEFNENYGNPSGNANNNNCFATSGLQNNTQEIVAFWQYLGNEAVRLGVKNITWVWNPECGDKTVWSAGTGDNQHLLAAFPGRKYVQWIACDSYDKLNEGAPADQQNWYNYFSKLFPDYPMMIGENGEVNPAGPCSAPPACTSYQGQDAYWSALATAVQPGGSMYPGVHAIVYFNSCPFGCTSSSYNWVLGALGLSELSTIGAEPYFSYMPQL